LQALSEEAGEVRRIGELTALGEYRRSIQQLHGLT